MFRFLFRFMAMVALAVAVIMAVVDATRTIAASELVLTPLNTSWLAVSPDTFAALQILVAEKAHPLLWDPVIVSILALPGAVVLAVLALLLFAVGRKPDRRGTGFAFEN